MDGEEWEELCGNSSPSSPSIDQTILNVNRGSLQAMKMLIEL